ncbi:hypothetical protein BDW74DRAFT_176033 [Aspergillus multicolor]|uniref:uncharacterized protein n=1 Tax=Aspergillus multicolor TaxID=41759 RepID=UPI003CCD6FE0
MASITTTNVHATASDAILRPHHTARKRRSAGSDHSKCGHGTPPEPPSPSERTSKFCPTIAYPTELGLTFPLQADVDLLVDIVDPKTRAVAVLQGGIASFIVQSLLAYSPQVVQNPIVGPATVVHRATGTMVQFYGPQTLPYLPAAVSARSRICPAHGYPSIPISGGFCPPVLFGRADPRLARWQPARLPRRLVLGNHEAPPPRGNSS